jgi:hypothetical protein
MHRAQFEVQLAVLAGAVVARINDAIVEQRPQIIPCVATGHRPHVVHVKVNDSCKVISGSNKSNNTSGTLGHRRIGR